jgi:predicted RNase H-like nuclease (RuvC/YqgF family)
MEQDHKNNEKRKITEHICTKEATIDNVADGVEKVKNDVNALKSDIVKIQSINERTIESLDRMESKLTSMDKRLFIDNGTLSIQTQLRDGTARMGQIEANIRTIEAQSALNIKTMSDKIEDVKNEPKKYAAYTIGLLTLIGMLFAVIIYITNNNGNKLNDMAHPTPPRVALIQK